MDVLLKLRQANRINRQQLIAAERFRRTPHAYALPPSWTRVMIDAVSGRSIGQIEQERGWLARSTKCVIALLLDGLVEMGSRTDLEPVKHLEDRDAAPLSECCATYGFTTQQRRLFVASISVKEAS